jgi:DNA-binding response OmpR family regulator
LLSTTAEPLPVLVVDDDSSLSRTLCDILRLHGYEAAMAGTGREGLAKAESRLPALAVVDLRLPDMDGMELVSRLHEMSQLSHYADGSESDRERSVRAGFDVLLVKPVPPDQLLNQLANVA